MNQKTNGQISAAARRLFEDTGHVVACVATAHGVCFIGVQCGEEPWRLLRNEALDEDSETGWKEVCQPGSAGGCTREMQTEMGMVAERARYRAELKDVAYKLLSRFSKPVNNAKAKKPQPAFA